MTLMVVLLAKYFIIVPLALYLWVFVKASKAERLTLLYRTAVALIAVFLLTLAAGSLFHETRPYLLQHRSALISNPPSDNSFPSDHTITGFTASLLTLPFSPAVGLASLVVSLLVGIGRVLALVHSQVDIIGGVVIAVAGSMIGYYSFRRKE